jgi:hypothetical protein
MAVASSGHSSGQSTFDVDAVPSNTKPGDFFKDADGGLYYIKSISGTTIDTGSPIWTQLEDAEILTVYRRSLELPTSAPVSQVVDTTNDRKIDIDGTNFIKMGLSTGTPVGCQQVYDRDLEQSLLRFYPAPTSTMLISIHLGHVFESPSSSTDIPYPESVLDAILERARAIWLSWRVGGVTPTELEGARRGVVDASGALDSITSQPAARDGRRARGR